MKAEHSEELLWAVLLLGREVDVWLVGVQFAALRLVRVVLV